MTQEKRRRSIVGQGLRVVGVFIRTLSTVMFGLIFIVVAITFLNYVVLSTPKNRAYRDLDPSIAACTDGFEKGWTVLADIGRKSLGMTMQADDGGWADPSDDELAVIREKPAWETKFGCALQHHVVPATKTGGRSLDYYLGFLEFDESGNPYALVAADAGTKVEVDAAMLQHAMEDDMHAGHMTSMAQVKPIISQLDALERHLSTGNNFVLVFVHGWRNDARIGNTNVADLRLYAAHAARFVQQRCPTEPRFCDMRVTAIYVGWRGARVDEPGLRSLFGETLGGSIGAVSAGATLFDRKPVSEAVAPGAISALRGIESVLAAKDAADKRQNKMLVIGHSLGGNMLASGLKDDMLKAVDRHKPGEAMPSVLGDLVVLVNPASEASKWTAIQREVWTRTPVRTNSAAPSEGASAENTFFPDTQKPVVVSITAALEFPAGGLRPGDCAWIGLKVDDKLGAARQRIRQQLAATGSMFDSGVDYDWATHDLFPAFKFDFRPVAAYLERLAAHVEERQPPGMGCRSPQPAGLWAHVKSAPLRGLAVLLGTFPFQNTVPEESHTIGNLDPPRPAAGILADALPSAAPFGTTHELRGYDRAVGEPHNSYATLADSDVACPPSNLWLIRARAAQKKQDGLFWQSDVLAPPRAGVVGQGKPAARFFHGLQLTGMAPITRANDPFWNVRAFDNELSRHDGYRRTSFICAVGQLVLDDTTGVPSPIRNRSDNVELPVVSAAPD